MCLSGPDPTLGTMTALRSLLIVVVGVVVLGLAPATASANPASATPAPDSACGARLPRAARDRIVTASDIGGERRLAALPRLRQHVARLWAITNTFVAHRDRRGLFALVLAVTERDAVMPMQNHPGVFDNPKWAPMISLHLLERFLDAIHAEFTGGVVPPHWRRYFDLAADCRVTGERVAMLGNNSHITVDLAYATAETRATTAQARDFFAIVDTIAKHGNAIVRATNRAYGVDLGPAFRFYFVGEGLDRIVGAGRATGPMLRAADVGYNVLTFGNGLALQNPATHDEAAADISALWSTGDASLAAFESVGLP